MKSRALPFAFLACALAALPACVHPAAFATREPRPLSFVGSSVFGEPRTEVGQLSVKSTSAAPFTDPREIRFMLGHEGWFFRLESSGRLVAQYGSTFGDEAVLPMGTIDFEAVAQQARPLLVDEKAQTDAQLVIVENDLPTQHLRYLSDDRFLRELLARHWEKWTFPYQNETRTRPLLENIRPASAAP